MLDNLKTYVFLRTTLSSDPAWEMDLYKSKDINGSWCTERGCEVAVLNQDYGYEMEVLVLLDDYSIEQLLLDNNIYVQFVEE